MPTPPWPVRGRLPGTQSALQVLEATQVSLCNESHQTSALTQRTVAASRRAASAEIRRPSDVVRCNGHALLIYLHV